MQLPDDIRLLEAVRRGDPDAFDAFYDRFSRPLYGLGLRWLGNAADAEELASETLVRAWRGAERFDADRGKVASWVFGIAHNVARDRWRAAGRDASVPMIENADLPSAPDATDALVDAFDIGVALQTLSPEHRAVLVMTYAHRATESEIAERFRVPPGTVKSRRFYALRALSQRLRGKDAE